MTRTEFSLGTVIVKLPSKSLTAPAPLAPFTVTFAPIIGSLLRSVTFPLTLNPCACIQMQNMRKRTANETRRKLPNQHGEMQKCNLSFFIISLL